MESLITIKEQQFYSADVTEILEFSSSNKCAIIIDENHLTELLATNANYSKSQISQIIIISDTLNTVLPNFIGKNVFIIAAIGVEQAIGMAFQSEDLNDKVVCILDQNDNELKQIIESVVV